MCKLLHKLPYKRVEGDYTTGKAIYRLECALTASKRNFWSSVATPGHVSEHRSRQSLPKLALKCLYLLLKTRFRPLGFGGCLRSSDSMASGFGRHAKELPNCHLIEIGYHIADMNHQLLE